LEGAILAAEGMAPPGGRTRGLSLYPHFPGAIPSACDWAFGRVVCRFVGILAVGVSLCRFFEAVTFVCVGGELAEVGERVFCRASGCGTVPL
jgi:hypothetical protein